MGFSSTTGNKYKHEAEPFKIHAGLYYEPMHSLQLTTAEWKLVTYLDIKGYKSLRPEYEALKQLTIELNRLCENYTTSSHCGHRFEIRHYTDKDRQIEYYMEQIHSLSRQPIEEFSFGKKRSTPFGFIGSLSKTLF
ncbi:hypothetical protein PV327_011616, partial [Microctonus hyperodae]